ncbi:dicarboxylate/amino acid:cation symporter [Methylobacterium sp. J-026]|uniref:dicarboxylate/amino acid:cation symporter n=1 Tax=Methylobacterium sp. J-026 TaxID=2836624 RepID=UPI001FB8E3E7|nr:dicarboxylate/amino acid:cation symporter [Methylobacterium sp. J-026]MCJ2135914.1 dicarboxylate/amino acid:cation symporter [Methylobacterium sp. J-026]
MASMASRSPADGGAVRSRANRTLSLQMLTGLVVGCVIGFAFPDLGKALLPIGQVFIKALRMIVIPLVFSSIALGIYNMGRELSAFGRIVLIAFVWFFIATGICILAGLLMNALVHPGIGADLSITGKVPANAGLKIDLVSFLVDLVPVNIVSAMAEQKILQVLLFGILFGASLASIGEVGSGAVAVLEGVQAAMMRMVRWIIALAPIAVAAVMAWLFASQGLGMITALGKLIATLYLGLVLVIAVMWLVLFAIGHNPVRVTQKIAEPLLLAFTTRSSETTLPIHMEILERFGVPNKIVSTVIPLGYSFNQDGTSLYISLATAFVVEAHGIPLDLPAMLTIIVTGLISTKGMGNVSGGGLVAATTVLVALGLPIEFVAVLAAIDVFLDMGRTTVNVFGNTVAVLLVDRFVHVSSVDAVAIADAAEPQALASHIRA